MFDCLAFGSATTGHSPWGHVCTVRAQRAYDNEKLGFLLQLAIFLPIQTILHPHPCMSGSSSLCVAGSLGHTSCLSQGAWNATLQLPKPFGSPSFSKCSKWRKVRPSTS